MDMNKQAPESWEKEEAVRQHLLRIQMQARAWLEGMIAYATRYPRRKPAVRDALINTTAIYPVGANVHMPFLKCGVRRVAP